ncbi:hypothetical protein GC105_10735 [Alkalibaculum sp. M08DMB]|uniref:Phage tail tape measure protein domain-containing protein n=1 Tax=Alkalibaculum sporogenes TaxID=2655001 RepID=A0A6A7KB75_9FIRM|nr:phage tail tape measure protein [Alkalibaculum sporogenes]MPW26263.1 hypothetical protein [Alkalibaculum sporogenes]
MSDGKVIVEARVVDDKVDKDLNQIEKKLKDSGKDMSEEAKKSGGKIGESLSGAIADKFGAGASKIESVASSMGLKVGAGALVAGAAVAGIGIAAVNVAADMDKAMGGYIAATGKGVEETERYQDVLEDIYGNNYGDSFEDIAGSMALVTQQMGDMDDASLQKITESAYLLRDTFDMDIQESLRGANSMMKEFGLGGEEAYNLIAQGAQNGLNQNQDLADQLAEYSVYYADMGFSAEEMFNAMANGIETGAYQVDYLNDAMKEFGIRSKDGSKASMEAFDALGLNADDMTKKFAQGGEGAKEAFNQVSEALIGVDDQVLQNQIGVSLFGTKWEDLGVDAIKALTDTDGAIDSTKDKLGEMEEVKYDNLGDMFQALKRSVELLLLPLGEALMPILLDLIDVVLPLFQDVLAPIIEAFSMLLEPIMLLVDALLPPLIEMFTSLMEPLMLLLEEIITPLIDVLMLLLEPIFVLVDELLPILNELFTALIEPLTELFSSIIPPVMEVLTALIDNAISPLIDIIKGNLIPIIKTLLNVFTAVFGGVADVVGIAIDTVMDIMGEIIEFIVNVFTGNWKGAWKNIANIFKSYFGGIGNIFKGIINTVIDAINAFTKSLGKIDIPDWVPSIGGKTLAIPAIPRLKVGMDYVPSDDFPAFLHKGEAVLTASEAEIYRSLGGNLGNLSGMSNNNSVYDNSSVTTNDFSGIFDGANFYVRDDQDITKIARELNDLLKTTARGKGVKR